MDLKLFIPVALVILLKMFCFLLGYLTIRLGYSLISNGVQGKFKFTSEFKGAKAGLASSSPGLLFVLLGVILIGYAMYVNKTYDIDYTPPDTSKSDVIYHPPIINTESSPVVKVISTTPPNDKGKKGVLEYQKLFDVGFHQYVLRDFKSSIVNLTESYKMRPYFKTAFYLAASYSNLGNSDSCRKYSVLVMMEKDTLASQFQTESINMYNSTNIKADKPGHIHLGGGAVPFP